MREIERERERENTVREMRGLLVRDGEMGELTM